MAAPSEPHDDSPGKSPSLLLAAIRRWPLLVLGAGVGSLVGFSVFAAQPPQYQSSAKVLVIKQRVEQLSGSDSRAAYVDDYVATQIPLIKSDLILTAAAKRPELSQLSEPLPENPNVAASVLLNGLTILRDKEATAGGAGSSSNILLMSYRCKNPRDSHLLLQAIIDAYKQKLFDVYAGQTTKQIQALEARIEAHKASIEKHSDEEIDLTRRLLEITGEDLGVIRVRVSADRDREFALAIELKDIEDQLELIKATGKNRRDRVAALTLLSGSKRIGSDAGAAAPEARILALRAERKELTERLGKDHPQIKAIDAQLEYFKKLVEDQNPDDPRGDLDELAQLQRQLERRLKTAKSQTEVIKVRNGQDETKLKDGLNLTVKINAAKSTIAEDSKRMGERQFEVESLRQTQKAELAGGYEASVITEPREGGKVGAGLVNWLVAGALLGVMLGIGLSMLAELTDKSFRSAAEIRRRLGAPVFGHLPLIDTKNTREADAPAGYDPTLVVAMRPKSVDAEAYRGIRAQLFVTARDEGHRVIQITSPNPGDGKSTLAANLAISIAQAGKRVILLDCDFRKPRVHKLFNITEPEFGLTSVTDGRAELATAIRHSEVDHLDLLPCGTRPSNPAELLSSAKFQEVLAELRKQYEYVIVDTPPLLAVSDPRVVAQRADGVLMVFKITKKARPQAERAREQLADMGANLIGIVVNGAGTLHDRAGYNYHYDYEYAQSYSDETPPGDFETAK